MSALVTTLSHSGGVQSHALLEMVLRGHIEKPENFVVINANPGMEDSRTYDFIRESRKRCLAQGIDYILANCPSLYLDIINTVANGATRIDNPPFWVKKPDGSRGKIAQGCTQFYKIAPMRRALRAYLAKKFPRSGLGRGIVESWIGFAQDEWHRQSESDVDYIAHRFPLIDAKLTRVDIDAYYVTHSLRKPPRSVCVACFSNGLDYFRDMYLDRPGDWEMAVEVDNAVELWHPRGLFENPVFVSASLIRLRDMPAINFGAQDEDLTEHHCNSGACFI